MRKQYWPCQSKMTKIEKPLEIEGIQVQVEWQKFRIGTSFFLPCIDHDRMTAGIVKRATSRGFRVKIIARVENGMWGIRVWRIA
jgi:hypothetical protein